VAKILILVNPYITRLLSEEFSMAAIGNFLITAISLKHCHAHYTTLRQYFYWRIISFGLNNLVNLSTLFIHNII